MFAVQWQYKANYGEHKFIEEKVMRADSEADAKEKFDSLLAQENADGFVWISAYQMSDPSRPIAEHGERMDTRDDDSW